MTDRRDLFEIYNDTDEFIPPGGLCAPVGGFTDRGEVKVGPPTEDSQDGLIVVVNFGVSPGQGGIGTLDPRVIVAHDPPADGEGVESGDTLGSVKGNWRARKGKYGFVCVGGKSGARVNAVRTSPGAGGWNDPTSGGCEDLAWLKGVTRRTCLRAIVVTENNKEYLKLRTDDGRYFEGTPLVVCDFEYGVLLDAKERKLTLVRNTGTGSATGSPAIHEWTADAECGGCAFAVFAFKLSDLCPCSPIPSNPCRNLVRVRVEWTPCFVQGDPVPCQATGALPTVLEIENSLAYTQDLNCTGFASYTLPEGYPQNMCSVYGSWSPNPNVPNPANNMIEPLVVQYDPERELWEGFLYCTPQFSNPNGSNYRVRVTFECLEASYRIRFYGPGSTLGSEEVYYEFTSYGGGGGEEIQFYDVDAPVFTGDNACTSDTPLLTVRPWTGETEEQPAAIPGYGGAGWYITEDGGSTPQYLDDAKKCDPAIRIVCGPYPTYEQAAAAAQTEECGGDDPPCEGGEVEGWGGAGYYCVDEGTTCEAIDGWAGAGYYCVYEESQMACVPTLLNNDQRCNTSLVLCSGPYATFEEAEAACEGDTPPDGTYNCVAGRCEPATGGTYPDYAACLSMCTGGDQRYDCEDGNCIPISGGGGEFGSLAECQNSCGGVDNSQCCQASGTPSATIDFELIYGGVVASGSVYQVSGGNTWANHSISGTCGNGQPFTADLTITCGPGGWTASLTVSGSFGTVSGTGGLSPTFGNSARYDGVVTFGGSGGGNPCTSAGFFGVAIYPNCS